MQYPSNHLAPLLRVGPVRSSVPRRRMIAAGALTALLLAGCSGGGSEATSAEGPASGGAAARDSTGANNVPGANSAPGVPSAPGAKPAAPSGQADVSKSATPVPGVGPKLTRNASLDLQVKDIAVAAARVRSIATGLQAQVLSEQIGRGGPGDPIPLQDGREADGNQPPEVIGELGGFGTLTLSVPADKLDNTLDQLGKIGTVLRRNLSSQDVTSQYVDTESRMKTMQASVDRVRALMARARDIGQVVALESEMSRRQADLESLKSQLDALKTSVERSTLAVSLSTPDQSDEPVTGTGFLAGLRSGWDAFAAAANGLLTALGAVLPFAMFFALVGSTLWWSWRRRQARSAPATAAEG